MDRGTAIGGVVLNEDKQPIANARIVFSVSGSAPGASQDRERLTMMGNYHTEFADAVGRWKCSHVPEKFGRISFQPMHPDYQKQTFYSNVPESARYVGVTCIPEADFLKGNAEMILKRGLIVSGTVVDRAGRPIARAKIAQDHDFHGPENNAMTDESGRFRFQNARPKEMILTIEAEGYAPTNHSFTVSSQMQSLSFTLPPGNPLHVKVVDEQGNPIPKASAQFTADPMGRSRLGWVGRTSEEGEILWSSAPIQETYSLSASGYESEKLTLMADGSEKRVTLKKRSTVDGKSGTIVLVRVSDADTKEPLERFRVLFEQTRKEGTSLNTYSADPVQGRKGECRFRAQVRLCN